MSREILNAYNILFTLFNIIYIEVKNLTKHSKYTYHNPKGEHDLTESSIDDLILKQKLIRSILKKYNQIKEKNSNVDFNGF